MVNNDEKERYKKELEEIKAKEDKNNSDELKENYKLIADLRSVSAGLVSIILI